MSLAGTKERVTDIVKFSGSLAVRAAGIAKGDAITSHPSVKKDLAGGKCSSPSRPLQYTSYSNFLPGPSDYDYKEQRVVVGESMAPITKPPTVQY